MESKNLKDLKLESSYSTDKSNLLKEFYIPVLSRAKEYYRITGYFSAASFAAAAKGISELVENKGSIKLITGFFTNKKDILAAEEARKNPEKILAEISKIVEEFGKVKDVFVRESIKAFAWLIANGQLEIKIAVPAAKYKDQYESIFHQKIGIIKDKLDNKLSFSGSINETGAAWLSNIENFKVFREWDKNEKGYFESDKDTFFRLWNNLSENVSVLDLDDAIKKKLILLAPSDKQDINLDILRGNSDIEINKNNQKFPVLRVYQNKALEEWTRKSFRGILEMATGTGKTLIGIKAIENFFSLESKGVCVVVTPTNEICKSWSEKINNLIKNDMTIMIGKDNPKWRKATSNCLHDFSKDRVKKVVFISTYDSLNALSELLIKFSCYPIFLLADEVHSFGAEKRVGFLKNENISPLTKYRLGLSATPERLYDDEGNEAINSFFDGIIFKYTLGEAIKDKVLANYLYYVKVVEMDSKEYSDYLRITKRIAKAYHLSKDSANNDYYNILITQRARIIKSSMNKKDKFEEILNKLIIEKDIKYTLVFCVDSEQLDSMSSLLEKYKIIYSKVTGLETTDERERILSEFAKGNIEVVLSIKILDEGVDIPEVKNAIILSSSRNPREYIQRRGRVLRRPKDYEKIAKIYDFLVVPKIEGSSADTMFELEKNIIRKELARMFEFVKFSKNASEIFRDNALMKTIKSYNLGDMYTLLSDKK